MIKPPTILTFDELAALYCKTQNCDAQILRSTLETQAALYAPEGWMLLECHQLDSSKLGTRTILPYGGQATFKQVPEHPISPRGLGSDMSIVVGILPAAALA